ncbi:uncharacterized protein MONBRDRAFT_33219 [Monosiga brevicollis MX1]|uniref:Uncharacterized protein n=1 Tax=Monosiga brevicollis TaxID=81824 RepID=A9V483_MONBE|nr:uncharacterized protein MONBRDRAFT_33219 [Monosiga brevicollis MX1]EDQ87662.1 predicted protein [Monosiga brevicollis MX1]|eukprot:XP_001747582.1 hypothetical protein [Monosiga brevicollis MX1]
MEQIVAASSSVQAWTLARAADLVALISHPPPPAVMLRHLGQAIKHVVFLPYHNPKWSMPLYWAALSSIGGYLATIAIQNIVLDLAPVNLKHKYNASWALVTGASSGIGKAMAQKLAAQGINVVLAALGDDLLDNTTAELQAQYPHLKFVKCAVNLAAPDFMDSIVTATEGLDVTLVFNNAGFITTGFFHRTPIGRNNANMACNATCIIPITHYFLNKMIAKGQRGLVAFTSSSAGFVPNPLSILYPSTKSFMTVFATSLAAEIKSKGIDTVVVHPSPMATNFFQNSNGMQALESFKRFAVGPSVIADVVFNSAGRFVVRDQGFITIVLRIVTKHTAYDRLVASFSTPLQPCSPHLNPQKWHQDNEQEYGIDTRYLVPQTFFCSQKDFKREERERERYEWFEKERNKEQRDKGKAQREREERERCAALANFTPTLISSGERRVVATYNVSSETQAVYYAIDAEGYDTPFYVLNLTAKNAYEGAIAYGALTGQQGIENINALLKTILPGDPELQAVLERFLDLQFKHHITPHLPQEFLDEFAGLQEADNRTGFNTSIVYSYAIALGGIAVGDVEADILYLLEGELLSDAPQLKANLALRGLTSSAVAGAIATALRERNIFQSCSMFGAFGSRTVGGQLRSGRNLDWLAQSGLAKNKLITIYHYPDQIPYATVAFAGFPGAITGMSAAGVTVHEAGNDSKDVTLNGFVWPLRLRAVMGTVKTQEDALDFWRNTNNTMGINHGIGTASDAKFVALETKAGYTAYFVDNDAREANFSIDGKQYGFPLKDAVWRTNHGYDGVIVEHAVEGRKPSSDSQTRYVLLHDAFVDYEARGVLIDDLQAVNLTAIVGDKGPSKRADFLTCDHAQEGSNIVSATFLPYPNNVMYVAYESGSGDQHRPACCNGYLRFNMSDYF